MRKVGNLGWIIMIINSYQCIQKKSGLMPSIVEGLSWAQNYDTKSVMPTVWNQNGKQRGNV